MIPANATADDCRAIIRAARIRLEELTAADPHVYAVKRTYTGKRQELSTVAYATQYQGRYGWLADDLTYSGGPFAAPVDGFGSLFTAATREWAQTILDLLKERDELWKPPKNQCTYEIVTIAKPQQPPS